MAEIEDEPLYLPLTKDTPVGSKVICIDDDHGWWIPQIQKGQIYTVGRYDDRGYVYLEECPGDGWFLNRFKVL